MRIRFLILGSLVSLCALALTSACSSSSSGGNGGGSGDCNVVASTACSKLEQCSPLAIKLSYGDKQTCVTRIAMSCAAGTTAPGASVTPAQFGACARAFSQVACKDLMSGNFAPAACTIKGSLANGKACGSADQCKSGYCGASSSMCGTCGAIGAAGATCTSSDGCESGLACNSKGVCATPAAAGGSCTDMRDCAAGLACTSGTCAQPVAAGGTCTGGDCDQLAGAFCNPQTKICETIQTADAGQPCGLINGGYVSCNAAGHCSIPQGQSQGTCQAHAADGASCDDTNGPSCLSPALCLNGKCTLPDPSSCK
jgi:hypothetical protein